MEEESALFHCCTAIEKECHVIRDYHWRGRIKKLFEMEVSERDACHCSSDVMVYGDILRSGIILYFGNFNI